MGQNGCWVAAAKSRNEEEGTVASNQNLLVWNDARKDRLNRDPSVWLSPPYPVLVRYMALVRPSRSFFDEKEDDGEEVLLAPRISINL